MVGVLVLAGCLLLPGLHHLSGHDGGVDNDEPCALCLLLNLSFLAVLVLPGLLLTVLVSARLGLDLGAVAVKTRREPLRARGPPLSI